MQETMIKLYEMAAQFLLNLLGAILIFLIGKWLARLFSDIVEKAMIKAKINKTLSIFTKQTVYFSILVFVTIAVLNKVGVATNSFIAIIGAAGLAVGFAFQGALANFAAGVMLIIFQPFQVDDFIEAGGAAGTVKEIQIFNTVMESPDKKLIIVPNSKITADKIVIYVV